MDKEKKGVLIVLHAYINKIYSNGNAEYTGFSFITGREVWLNMHLQQDQRGLDAPAYSHLISSVGEAASRSAAQPGGGGPPTSTHARTHTFSWSLDNLLNCINLDRDETLTVKVS